jgi:hypothetical protein
VRLVHHYAITDRRGGPLDVVAPDDFSLAFRAAAPRSALPQGALAYCADLARERLLFTCHTAQGLQDVFAAPFMFTEQLRAAGSVVSVPMELLPEIGIAPGHAAPVFVFSIGRAGTTLLASVLAAAGLHAASEPDLLTQATMLTDEQRALLPPGADCAMITACVETIGRALGQGAFLKLRSQCNARPLTLLEATPRCRAIFVLRGAYAWAVSRHRAFREPPNHVAMLLRQAMDALDKLLHARAPLMIVWFEELARDPLAVLASIAPQARPDPRRIASAMARDSQEGTILGRTVIQVNEVTRDYLRAFDIAWEGARASATWGGETHALLHRMFT